MLLLSTFALILLIAGGVIVGMGAICIGIGFLSASLVKRKYGELPSDDEQPDAEDES